jgi:acetyltransferase-like isoleucine patch superfamily enzyme
MDPMERKRLYYLFRGYSFMARHILAGKVVDKCLEALAFFDYRLHILLCLWHPDMATRIKLIKSRGVTVGKNVFIDYGVWIDVTHPDYVTIEDYALLGFMSMVISHDAGLNKVTDMPIKALPTVIGYNCAVAPRAIIMPGVTVGAHAGVLAGAVVTHDVGEGEVAAGVPAKIISNHEQLIAGWQADMRENPERYFEQEHKNRAPSNPWLDQLYWRKEGIVVQPPASHLTGTPFDYIVKAKQMQREMSQEEEG